MYELSKGTLFATVGGQTMTLGDGIPVIEEVEEFSVSEIPSKTYHLNTEFNFEVSGIDLALLNDSCCMALPNNKFVVEHSIPIMIQARWHKRSRIRKKWLKKFGMKPDTVKMRANAAAGEYHTDDGSFDFEVDDVQYLWRPDQKRRGLKIEW